MRSVLLASAATFALILAHPGFAQTTPPNTQPRAVGQQNPAPADASAATDPTVPAELQLAPPDQQVDPLGQPLPRQRGGAVDRGEMRIQQAQNEVPPSQDQSLPGQPAAPKGQAANQEGQTQPQDPGTPTNPVGPPGMPAPIPPGLTQSLPGQPAAPQGRAQGQQGQATPDQHSDVQPDPVQTPILIAQADPMPSPTAAQAAQPSMADSATMPEGGHEPLSRSASNIDPGDTQSTIAPRLPAPPLGPDASPAQLLHAARDALGHNATGEAQEALERAETRLLDRSTDPSEAGMPDKGDAVSLIHQAREALGHHDMAQAMQSIDAALQRPAVMQSASNM